MNIDFRSTDYLNYVRIRICNAPTEEICELALELSLTLQRMVENYDLSQFNKIVSDARHEALVC